jgi:phenylacetate-CoA ligase
MDMSMISRVLWLRRTLRRQERWSEQELREHQRRELATLRAFAYARSPFYRRFHGGLDRAPLGELPVLTKATLMDSFDQISTDPVVRLADLQAYLATLRGSELFRGRYWVSATSGSSGRKSIIASSRAEWAMILGSYSARERVGGRPDRPDPPGDDGRGQLHHAVASVLASRGHCPQPVHRQRASRRRRSAA